jgi:hypothetical protein
MTALLPILRVELSALDSQSDMGLAFGRTSNADPHPSERRSLLYT